MSRSKSSLRKFQTIEAFSGSTLKKRNVAVFRKIGDEITMRSLAEIFKTETSNFFSIPRSEGDEKNHSISLIQMSEFRNNREYLGSITINQLISTIYDEVPTIRQRMDVSTGELRVLGNKKRPVRPIGILFDNDSREKLLLERQRIISVLEDLTPFQPESFSWMGHITPHLSLGKVAIGDIQQASRLDNFMDQIQDQIPPRISIDRATIYTP